MFGDFASRRRLIGDHLKEHPGSLPFPADVAFLEHARMPLIVLGVRRA
jgi:hypothetical protein